MALSDKVYLVGMPGAGKSTFGAELAKSMGRPFIDLDHEIERHENCTIAQIFTDKGEAYFRQLESEQLKKISNANDAFVMATGGGTPCFYDGIQVMLEQGVVVYIHVELAQLKQRLQKTDLSTRPKFDHETDVYRQLAHLFEIREPVYRMAHIVVHEQELDNLKIAAKIKGIV